MAIRLIQVEFLRTKFYGIPQELVLVSMDRISKKNQMQQKKSIIIRLLRNETISSKQKRFVRD